MANKNEQTGKIKVKRDRLAAKLICGSVIPIALTGGILTGIYFIYRLDQSYSAYLWLDDKNNYVWEGTVDKLSTLNVQVDIPASNTHKYGKLYFTAGDTDTKVPIKSVSYFWNGAINSSTGAGWSLNENGEFYCDDVNYAIKFSGDGTSTQSNLDIRVDYNGRVKLHLDLYEA